MRNLEVHGIRPQQTVYHRWPNSDRRPLYVARNLDAVGPWCRPNGCCSTVCRSRLLWRRVCRPFAREPLRAARAFAAGV